ncbi:MAG: YgjP-like metallopeptidase domain-containing protein [Spirochaetota bacterium]
MCHLVHFNHTKEFYALLTSMLPEWKKNKEILDYSEI